MVCSLSCDLRWTGWTSRFFEGILRPAWNASVHNSLVRWLMAELLAVRRPMRHPLDRIIGFPLSSEWNHGSALSIILYDAHSTRLSFFVVFERLERHGIDLRSVMHV